MSAFHENAISKLGAISCQIADPPQGLLIQKGSIFIEKRKKEVDASFVDDWLTLQIGPSGNIGDDPTSLKLQLWIRTFFHICQNGGNCAIVNHLLNVWLSRVSRDDGSYCDYRFMSGNYIFTSQSGKIVVQMCCLIMTICEPAWQRTYLTIISRYL